ncbi:hypothetical protein LRD69_22380 [Streptomyces sp. JH14]|uniref:hypothetical protein n=1 Tax=Streptomyces sp. JH14 TaxID=2793630 RepID=UPI0023F8D9F5|nr:hypothetical protein [Streptomyces sp. JH14]MDF6044844.1 hypothetical protein [Streptomyces sp. JH14]
MTCAAGRTARTPERAVRAVPHVRGANGGGQSYAAADTGRRVVWIDGATSWTDPVTGERPAGFCG